MKIVTVVGARPQFIKASAVSRMIRTHYSNSIEEIIIHTGQHHDENMSQVFFSELDIPNPKYNLDISGGSHGEMTGRMLQALEKVFNLEKPKCVLVYGDTNSTLAATLAAAKLKIPVAHVEAGLRSFNRNMPEEINRVVVDHLSSLLLCPTQLAVKNLTREGITAGVHLVGDVMFDVSTHYREIAFVRSDVIKYYGLMEGNYVLATCHRAENTDDPVRLEAILSAIGDISKHLPVVFPAHPRIRTKIVVEDLKKLIGQARLIDPLPYLDMVRMQQSAKVILTDSGGMQKEAFFYGVPCITIRDETEWMETVELGWNRLVRVNRKEIVSQVLAANSPSGFFEHPYGNGNASQLIIESLLELPSLQRSNIEELNHK
jgi:UDP-GlcNAc3NAcA epimerase